MRIKTMIPNLFTFLNMLAGCGAVVMLSDLKYDLAFYLVCLGIFFDFFDGFFARKFNVSGPLGVQLDSLADMITSGFVPGYVVFSMLKNDNNIGLESYLPYLGFSKAGIQRVIYAHEESIFQNVFNNPNNIKDIDLLEEYNCCINKEKYTEYVNNK